MGVLFLRVTNHFFYFISYVSKHQKGRIFQAIHLRSTYSSYLQAAAFQNGPETQTFINEENSINLFEYSTSIRILVKETRLTIIVVIPHTSL